MLKLLLTGIWVCVVTLGAVWFSIGQATAPQDHAAAAPKVETELLKGEALSIPLIADGAVQGYFISRVSFVVDKTKFAQAKLPIRELVTDELYQLLVGSSVVDLRKVASFDLAGFKDRIRTGLNGRFGGDVVSDVLIEQLDYLSKEDIRTNTNAQRDVRRGVKIAQGEVLPATAAAASGGH